MQAYTHQPLHYLWSVGTSGRSSNLGVEVRRGKDHDVESLTSTWHLFHVPVAHGPKKWLVAKPDQGSVELL